MSQGGDTALHLLCQQYNDDWEEKGDQLLATAEYLIKRGADVTAINGDEETPLDMIKDDTVKEVFNELVCNQVVFSNLFLYKVECIFYIYMLYTQYNIYMQHM